MRGAIIDSQAAFGRGGKQRAAKLVDWFLRFSKPSDRTLPPSPALVRTNALAFTLQAVVATTVEGKVDAESAAIEAVEALTGTLAWLLSKFEDASAREALERIPKRVLSYMEAVAQAEAVHEEGGGHVH